MPHDVGRDLATWDTQTLLESWAMVEETEARQRHFRQRIEFELKRRMEADGATAIPHETLDVALKQDSPTYDWGIMRGLAKLVPPEELAKGFKPAHWGEPVWIEDKWNMTRIKPLAKYGDAVKQVIEAATIPGPARLSIRRKEVKA